MNNKHVPSNTAVDSEITTTSDKARVCSNTGVSNCIRTHIAGSVIEEHNNNPVDNPYFVTKSQEDFKKQKAFAHRLYCKQYLMKQKEIAKHQKKRN